MKRNVLTLSIYTKEDEQGVKKYDGIASAVPDDITLPEFIGFIQMASMDLANHNNTQIKEFQS